ncbi:MAG: isoprenoid biosynthesis glyoxalase ElbB [Bacteroidales bacterium]|nr:MAG: isoprenoid biosynthesis glyoxalase ElbB [Bacteroidales bacterium]
MNNPVKFAVVLSGCGVFDGAEIHEATLTLYAILKNNAVYDIFAPDISQHHVVNHLTGQEMKETRNVMIESARIARGKISPLSEFSAEEYDALIFPGGFGVAKNLSDFAFKGNNCTVNEEAANAISAMVKLNKPVGALCISPVILAKVLGDIEVTIGSDEGTAQALEEMGAKHENTTHEEIVVDNRYKIVTTPCYMLDANIVQIANGTENVIKEMLKLI